MGHGRIYIWLAYLYAHAQHSSSDCMPLEDASILSEKSKDRLGAVVMRSGTRKRLRTKRVSSLQTTELYAMYAMTCDNIQVGGNHDVEPIK